MVIEQLEEDIGISKELPSMSNPDRLYGKYPEDKMILLDFGRLPSLRKISMKPQDFKYYRDILPEYQFSIKNMNYTNLQNLKAKIFSDESIRDIVKIVKATGDYAVYRILPYGFCDSKNYGSNRIKFIPRNPKELKLKPFPIELKMDQEMKAAKRVAVNEIMNQTDVETGYKNKLFLTFLVSLYVCNNHIHLLGLPTNVL